MRRKQSDPMCPSVAILRAACFAALPFCLNGYRKDDCCAMQPRRQPAGNKLGR